MKALVPAGGTGSRLRPITHSSAKQLVPVANKPILFYGLEAIAAAGITEVALVVGDTRAEIEAAVGDGAAFGLAVTYIPQDAPRGLAHTVLIAHDFLGEDDFVMYLGDNILKGGVAGIVREFATTKPNAQILLARVPSPERFGVVELDGDRIVRLVEKPKVPPSEFALVGVYVFDRNVHDAVRAVEPSARGELEITDAIQWLVDRGLIVRAHHIEGWWKDTGKPRDLLEANELVLRDLVPSNAGVVDDATSLLGPVAVGRGARIERSTIQGPVCVGEGATVTNAFIGPYTSIGASCSISDSHIEHSLVMERCVVRGFDRLEESLLAPDVTLEPGESKPHARGLVVGFPGREWIVRR